MKRPGEVSLRKVRRCMRSLKASSRRVSILWFVSICTFQPKPHVPTTGLGFYLPSIIPLKPPYRMKMSEHTRNHPRDARYTFQKYNSDEPLFLCKNTPLIAMFRIIFISRRNIRAPSEEPDSFVREFIPKCPGVSVRYDYFVFHLIGSEAGLCQLIFLKLLRL